jgi:hypothetical protein
MSQLQNRSILMQETLDVLVNSMNEIMFFLQRAPPVHPHASYFTPVAASAPSSPETTAAAAAAAAAETQQPSLIEARRKTAM